MTDKKGTTLRRAAPVCHHDIMMVMCVRLGLAIPSYPTGALFQHNIRQVVGMQHSTCAKGGYSFGIAKLWKFAVWIRLETV
jgi:hypothetical protein